MLSKKNIYIFLSKNIRYNNEMTNDRRILNNFNRSNKDM